VAFKSFVKITQKGIELMNMTAPLEKSLSEPVKILTDENLWRFNEYLELMLSSFCN